MDDGIDRARQGGGRRHPTAGHQARPVPPSPVPATWVLAGIVVLAALSRWAYIDRSLWSDEVGTVIIAGERIGRFLQIVRGSEMNMSAYYLLLRFWLWAGKSEAMLRSLSVIAAVATVPALYVLGRRLFDTRVALVASLLLTVNGFHVFYSQEVRGYSLATLLVVLSLLYFVRSIEQPSRGNWLGYIVTSVVAVYTNFMSLLVLPAQWISLLLLPREDLPRRGLIASARIIGVLLLPVAFFLLFRNRGQVDWVDPLNPKELSDLAYAFAGWPSTHGPAATALVVAYGFACIAGLTAGVQAWSTHRKSPVSWHHGLVLASFLVPLVAAVGLSLAKSVLVPRFFIFCLPALTLIAAVGICNTRPAWLLGTGLAAIVALSALGTIDYYKHAVFEDWRGVARYLIAHGSASDAVVVYGPFQRRSLDYYYDRSPGAPTLPRTVFTVSRAEDWQNTPALTSLPSRHKRVWLIRAHLEGEAIGQAVRSWGQYETTGQAIQATLARAYPAMRAEAFPGVSVVLFSQTSLAHGTGGVPRNPTQ